MKAISFGRSSVSVFAALYGSLAILEMDQALQYCLARQIAQYHLDLHLFLESILRMASRNSCQDLSQLTMYCS